MKLVNKTALDSRLLRTFIRRVMEHEMFTPAEIAQFKVAFRYRRRSHCREDAHPGGYAYYNSKTFVITPVNGVMPDKRALAKVIAHELAHCQGVKHRRMHTPAYGWVKGWQEHWQWAEALPLAFCTDPTPVKPTGVEKISVKAQHCERMLGKWQSRVKLAKTKEAYWRRKLGYYEKRRAAMQPAHDEAVKQVAQVMAIVTGQQEGGAPPSPVNGM